MKGLYYVCCLISVVSASRWFHRRESEPKPCDDNAPCWSLYKPIIDIMETPDFTTLLGQDGKLSLDCRLLNTWMKNIQKRVDNPVTDGIERMREKTEQSTRSERRKCGNQVLRCDGNVFIISDLDIAWDQFCNNAIDLEAVPACWQSSELTPALQSCVSQVSEGNMINELPACIGVAASEVCGVRVGSILKQVVSGVLQNNAYP